MIRKRHNMQKRLQSMAQLTLKNTAIVMSLSSTDGKCVMVDTKRRIIVRPGEATAKTIANCTFKWAFLLVAWATEANGKDRMVTDYQLMAAPYRQDTLIPHLNEAHSAMFHAEQDKGNAVYDAAWVAVPVPTLDDEAMQDLMVETLELVINGDKQKQRMAG